MSRTKIALTAAAAGLLLAACSTSSPGTSNNNNAPAPPSTQAAAASPSATTSSPADTSSQLSGKWSGQYSGTFSGTFKLHWRESGSHLHGIIHISDPGNNLPINGTVRDGKISFGTVGSLAITYSGTVSGDSMSGHWQIANGQGGGPWSASKV